VNFYRDINRLIRIGKTGFAFATFGICALILSFFVFPVISILVKDNSNKRRYVRRSISIGCRTFISGSRRLGLFSYQLIGYERLLKSGSLIVANHPTLIDIVFMLAWVPDLDCIVKKEIAGNPFLYRALSSAGYTSNADIGGLIDDCAAILRNGGSVMIFPEGTRTNPNRKGFFKRGAAHVALAADAQVVPVLIRCRPVMLTKRARWFEVPESTPHFDFEVLEPICAADFRRAGESQTPAAFRLTKHMEDLLLAPVDHPAFVASSNTCAPGPIGTLR
jgi:1-acyl-sn-glycerol-3-phosphate acyltransferase